MGKKTRLGGGAVGRRTILQLSPPGNRGGNPGEREEANSGSDDEQDGDGHKFVRHTNIKTPAVKATEGLSLLGAYEDSDEEDARDRSAANSRHNQPADIDSTLANFMAEIDAITTQPSTDDTTAHPSFPNATPPRPEAKPQEPPGEGGQNQQSTEFEYNTQDSLAGVGIEMGDWQEVWDENSGCYYYWNTLTNEVSWELPHYLADQVQSLGHSANSTSVNGNGSAHASYYSEDNPVSAAAEAPVMETKAKEVIENIVGLTSEEEENQGVAASLLGPLIPSEVKEAEEKWRKKLLTGLDETVNSLDSDEEDVKPAGSPPIPFLEPEIAVTAQKDVCTKKLSGDNSGAEEEPEEDTVDLELALERKKAELRALEDGDGSAGGSSPLSEASQETAGARGVQLQKKRWKTVFPSAASPDSNSRGSDVVDNSESATPNILESVVEVEGEDQKAETPEDTAVPKLTFKDEEETPELKFQIGELANTLTSKMEFLGINKKTISNFHLLLLQTETRIADWREGALNGIYLRRKLQEAAEHIKFYELNATPKGWSCHWDSDGEIMEVEMEMDDDDEEPPAPGTEEDGGRSCSVGMKIIESATSFGKGQKRKAGQMNKNIMIGSSPIIYTQSLLNTAPLMPAAAYWGMPAVAASLVPCEPPAPPVPALPLQPPLPPSQPAYESPGTKASAVDKAKKPKKEKSSKKSKTKMPSLVKKWQSIQKELDEEEKSSSSDEDREQLNKKNIEDWKQQQLVTGKASKNANFEALPADWRERLKKRKLMNTT
uniref:Formin binding protein 4 n=1 Tax=Nothobranchius furzeri TaxID=105023 RepID=A0A1A8ANS5_NOTFU